jgi:hypothetical protein
LHGSAPATWPNDILVDRSYTWLKAFFADEPAWEARLSAWIVAHASIIKET